MGTITSSDVTADEPAEHRMLNPALGGGSLLDM
jgi:hypothetical protein